MPGRRGAPRASCLAAACRALCVNYRHLSGGLPDLLVRGAGRGGVTSAHPSARCSRCSRRRPGRPRGSCASGGGPTLACGLGSRKEPRGAGPRRGPSGAGRAARRFNHSRAIKPCEAQASAESATMRRRTQSSRGLPAGVTIRVLPLPSETSSTRTSVRWPCSLGKMYGVCISCGRPSLPARLGRYAPRVQPFVIAVGALFAPGWKRCASRQRRSSCGRSSFRAARGRRSSRAQTPVASRAACRAPAPRTPHRCRSKKDLDYSGLLPTDPRARGRAVW